MFSFVVVVVGFLSVQRELYVKPADAHNLLRPETAESLMILYRITKVQFYVYFIETVCVVSSHILSCPVVKGILLLIFNNSRTKSIGSGVGICFKHSSATVRLPPAVTLR